MDLIGIKDNNFRMAGMDMDGNTNIVRGYAYGEGIVGGGTETVQMRNASGGLESKTENSASVGISGVRLVMKSETNNVTKANTTTLGISLGSINMGYLINIHTEFFIPIITERHTPNKK